MQALGDGGRGDEEEEKAEDAAMKKEGHTWWRSRIRWWVKQVSTPRKAGWVGLIL